MAPATLLAAVLYYFGLERAHSFFGYFGVDSSVLSLTAVDYISRSAGALIVPLIIMAILALLALWGDGALRAHLATESGPRLLRTLVPVMAISGLVLAAGGLLGAFWATALTQIVAGAPLGLAIGVALLAYAARMRRHLHSREQRTGTGESQGWATVWEWAVVFTLVAISLFAAANDIGAASGTADARQFVAGLQSDPNVAVYSEQGLSLHGPGVREVSCHDPQGAYRFRYDGLRLVLESGGQYLFVPKGWTRTQGVAFLIPQSSSLRLEFYPPSARDTALPSTC
ncbi:MAG TPA: hypothetical protein VGS19_22095 [Streptosporangiaceae bacterium]|nr:hypothetical protein [Streptosporangiaceae bacterium]